MTCNHKFRGHKDGVTCIICGLSMTPDEYQEYLNSSAPEAPEAPEAPAKKPRKPRKPAKKKEEATANE